MHFFSDRAILGEPEQCGQRFESPIQGVLKNYNSLNEVQISTLLTDLTKQFGVVVML
jgi:hypothetical protein